MATLQELFELRSSSELRNRVAAAGWREAKAIFTESESVPNHAERLIWAVRILRDVGDGGHVNEVFKAVIVLLESDNVTDAQIETAVSQVVDKFATAGV